MLFYTCSLLQTHTFYLVTTYTYTGTAPLLGPRSIIIMNRAHLLPNHNDLIRLLRCIQHTATTRTAGRKG